MNFSIITFGCKLNQAESDKIFADLISVGFSYSDHNPNIIIVNVCAVTHKAVREGRQKVAGLRRKFRNAKIIVTGCIDEGDWPGVELWVRNKNKDNLLKLVCEKFKPEKSKENSKIPKNKKNRGLIKIQTGCNNFCAYCIVPLMRGKPKSTPARKIISEIRKREREGFKEVILTGVNIGLYKDKDILFVNLIKSILEETNIERIRLGSLWPTHINSALIELYSKNPRLCPHFHLSIQSGSDKILKSMGRTYKREKIFKIVENCRAKISNINLTTDIIVGFPGETDEDFRDTKDLIQKIQCSKVHVFKYSKRPGTRAEEMANQVDEKVKNSRVKIITALADNVAKQTKQKFIGKILPVLWESKKAGCYYGFTDNYIRIKKRGEKLSNQIEYINIKNKNLDILSY